MCLVPYFELSIIPQPEDNWSYKLNTFNHLCYVIRKLKIVNMNVTRASFFSRYYIMSMKFKL